MACFRKSVLSVTKVSQFFILRPILFQPYIIDLTGDVICSIATYADNTFL